MHVNFVKSMWVANRGGYNQMMLCTCHVLQEKRPCPLSSPGTCMALMYIYIIIPLCLFCSDGEVKGLCGIYQRIILVPRPDYASRVGTSTLFIISPKSNKGYFRLHCKSANALLHSSLFPGHSQLSIAFLYCKRQKLVWGLGMRLTAQLEYISLCYLFYSCSVVEGHDQQEWWPLQ